MSLILAEVSSEFGWFVGDTLLSGLPYDNPNTINGDSHALKIHILNEKVCIALAGKYDLGLCAIHQIVLDLEKHPQPSLYLINKFCSDYQELCFKKKYDLEACEFLVMIILPSENILAKVVKGTASMCQKAYIGDSVFYRKLQGKRKPYIPPAYRSVQQPDGSFVEEPFMCPDIEKNFVEITDAMEAISRRAIESTVGVIGNNVVRVGINRQNVFEYFQFVERGVSIEEGEFGNTLLSSTSPKHGVGIYYFKGYGYLFIAGDYEGCRKITAASLDGFIAIARQYSLELVGGTW